MDSLEPTRYFERPLSRRPRQVGAETGRLPGHVPWWGDPDEPQLVSVKRRGRGQGLPTETCASRGAASVHSASAGLGPVNPSERVLRNLTRSDSSAAVSPRLPTRPFVATS